jgi:hypothetical protein
MRACDCYLLAQQRRDRLGRLPVVKKALCCDVGEAGLVRDAMGQVCDATAASARGCASGAI